MSALMTSKQRKQIKRLFEDGADWALDIVEKELTQEEAQRIIRRGNELRADFPERIRALARSRFADQVVNSTYTYPPEFKGLKPIHEQVELLMEVLNDSIPNLDPTWALEQGQAWYDSLKRELPKWIEGPVVYVWKGDSYHSTLQIVLDKLATTRPFQNWRQGQLDPAHLQQIEFTAMMEQKLHRIQPGSFLIMPSQLGMKHRGKSVQLVCDTYDEGEFGMGSLAGNCLALTHPERFVRYNELGIDLPGDKYSSDADGVFDSASYLSVRGGGLEFGTRGVRRPSGCFGSGSVFLPQNIAT